MKKLMRAIDRFCLKHRRFGIPRLMLYVIIGYAAVYLLAIMDRTNTLIRLLAFDIDSILRGEVWRIVTWIIIPSTGYSLDISYLLLTALTFYFYYFIGSTLEREWGTPKFTIYYFTGVLMNILYAVIVRIFGGATPFLSTHYLNLSMFFAFAALYPDHRVLLFFIIPLKIKWLAWANGLYFLAAVIASVIGGDYLGALIPVLAFFNFFLFCGYELVSRMRPMRVHRPNKTVDFKEAAKKYRASEEARPYRHKCAVCGKTDTQYPNLEFRYCSRCNGYHCFCMEHINNHIHFQ